MEGLLPAVRRMHTPKLGIYQLFSIISVCYTLFNVYPSLRSRFRNYQQAGAKLEAYLEGL